MLARSSPLSLRSLVALIALGLGLMSLIMALLTGNVYRDQTLKAELERSQKELRLKWDTQMQRLRQHALQFGVILRGLPDLRRSLEARDWAGLNKLLQEQLGSPYATAGVLNIVQINLYDARLHRRGQAGALTAPRNCGLAGAGSEIREGAVGYTLCRWGERLYLSVMLVLDEEAGPGYLQVLTDMDYAMELLEEEVGMPLRLRVGDSPVTVYRSPQWPDGGNHEDMAIVSLDLPDAGVMLPLHLDAAHDYSHLFATLRRTSLLVAVGTGAITLGIILLILAITRRALLDPIQGIVQHMRRVRGNRATLRERITPGGIAEMRELTDDFNAMCAELDQLYRTLENVATTDMLTQLGNRKRFHHDLATLAGGNDRRSLPFALLVMDLDKFKMINDTLGHNAGDLFLQLISERFKRELRDTDLLVTAGHHDDRKLGAFLSRLGGDEFAVLLPGVADEAGAAAVAQKLVAAANVPLPIEGVEVNAGVSIGIAFYPRDSADKDVLMHMADLAMYQAKRKGTGYAVYDRTMEPANAGDPHQGVFRITANKH